MNKVLKSILLFILFIPFIINAKESCTIVNGNGKDIGSEIACGTEHFYIIENNDDNIKMLSKYNLYVGSNFDKIALDIDKTYIKYKCLDESCNGLNNDEYFFNGEQVENADEWERNIFSKYNIDEITDMSGNNGAYESNGNIALYDIVYGEKYVEDGVTYKNSTYKLYPYTTINESTNGYALQNELARGVTGEKGNANYPIYATLPLFNDRSPKDSYYDNTSNFENGYTNFEFVDDTDVKYYLNTYKSNLNDMGFEVTNVDMLNMLDIKNLVYNLSNKTLPLSDWYEASLNTEAIEEDDVEYKNIGDLKQYLSNDYSWLWNTTYWTKTFVGNERNGKAKSVDQVYFISSSGDICYSATGACYGIPRAGIRPVITIAKENIKYSITTKTDGNGTIEVVDNAYGGDTISFKVTAKKGLKLSGLTIITDMDEIVEFSEEDISVDENNVYSIRTNKFTMPFENVTISAKWENAIINPKTGVTNYIILIGIVLIISSIIAIILKQRKSYLLK